MSRVLDTTVLIDVLRGHEPAVMFVLSLEDVPVCSEVTRVEIIRGLRSEERRSAERLFRQLRWVPVDETIARAAGELGRSLRRSHTGIGIADLIISATVEEVGLPLATTNVRHFPMLEGLRAPYRGQRSLLQSLTHVGLLSAAWATAQAEERLTKSSTQRSTRILSVMGGALIVVGAFLSWIAPATSAEGTSMPVSLFWSTEFSTMDSDPSFFASAGFIVILIGAVTVTG